MSIDSEVLNSPVVESLCRMFATEYTPRSLLFSKAPAVPAMLNAIGACAGFASQVAVWRELIVPNNRNPGDFLVCATTKSKEMFFLGEAINQFLFASVADRVSFLTLAAAALSGKSELPDIGELAGRVARSLGTEGFGRPRVPQSVEPYELPRAALARIWGKAVQILQGDRPAEWPALLGAAAHNIMTANRKSVAPSLAVRILFEAAVPMSKLDPATVEQSGVRIPSLSNWSMRALQPERNQELVAEVRNAMPAMPRRVSAPPPVIVAPTIGFLNLGGATYAALAAQDRAEIGFLFSDRVEASTITVPHCDVLFAYCIFDPSGGMLGQRQSLGELIRESGARIAVIASETSPKIATSSGFQKALDMGNKMPVNVVVVMDRKGPSFTRFFKSLFQDMWAGTPMPMAWVKLAPQGPHQAPDLPATLCIMAAGQVTFRR